MSSAGELPEALARRFGIAAAGLVERTAIAVVWRVELAGGGVAGLKVFHEEGLANEGPGLAWMRARDGAGVVRLLDQQGRAVLMEWQEGPSLGDLVRRGEDARAARELLSVAQRLHQGADTGAGLSLPPLDAWFGALRDVTLAAACPPEAARDMLAARDIAERLLAAPREVRGLHGDLHHDNIRDGARGWLAFDAKGVRGERAYELANAFRNPKGAAALVADPARIAALADLWSEGFGVERTRLLDWAAAKCALSICWRAKGPVGADAEFGLLARLIAARGG
ncbi:aminoglycoside/hydroxyurea antibiotic resistance kinase [Pseudooceanicola nanhaiensis]|jgi:streptomycin 6-kinase|uniref:Aminoglycoside/hydroxyurea antibiotic resistance kinase n=2 Tax=Pseudooceanicola nanhaiensis TaxID=375761 RepID=A0A917WGM9_9RHOB|nr:aminoglycoside phosphotransferase family protein [Pseudooceanicola nanhaiensis]GGM03574.1 aminoglycoside/hydroxyurea antibiotic resistance kinase [Pseudooceanicola nanhaiensis]